MSCASEETARRTDKAGVHEADDSPRNHARLFFFFHAFKRLRPVFSSTL